MDSLDKRVEEKTEEFCPGCDHGVVGGKVCEICGGRGYVGLEESIHPEFDPHDNGNQGS